MRRRTGRILLLAAVLAASTRAGVLVPEWSRPLPAPVVSASVGARTYGTEGLFLLIADGRVFAVSARDTLREVGRAPVGTTALAAWPTAPVGSSDIALLLAARDRPGSSVVLAWNCNGQQLWRVTVPGMSAIDSLSLVEVVENRVRLCAWQRGEPWIVDVEKQLWHYSASTSRLDLGFTPCDAIVGDVDGDGASEAVFFDGRQLAVFRLRLGRELRSRWPAPEPTHGSSGPLLASVEFDTAALLLVVTGETLRYVNGSTGADVRRLAAGTASGLSGRPAAVTAAGAHAYVSGVDPDGGWYLAELSARGPARPRLRLPLPAGGYVSHLSLLSGWPMAIVSTGYGPENFFIYAPGLAGTANNSPGYSGARYLRVTPLRIDADTLVDLAVVRTAADARWRVDLFANRTWQLAREADQARRVMEHTTLGRDENEVRRAVRRMRTLDREAGLGQASADRGLFDRFRLSERRRRTAVLLGAVLALLLVAGTALLAWLALSRRRPAGQQIENQTLAARVALAADLVAVDHNFISKGNTPAAAERIVEIRGRYGLNSDRNLGRLGPASSGSEVSATYADAISRLVDDTPTLPLLSFIQTTVRSALRGREVETLEVRPDEYRQLVHGSGRHIIIVANREYPDCFRQFRLFANPELRGTIEHIILDHLRHAGSWSEIVLSYRASTQWNRRLLLQFLSDGPKAIPFDNQLAHITSQLHELSILLRPGLRLSADAAALTEPGEKLWLSIADYIAVLEETRARLSTP